jgi:hypothetical protein
MHMSRKRTLQPSPRDVGPLPCRLGRRLQNRDAPPAAFPSREENLRTGAPAFAAGEPARFTERMPPRPLRARLARASQLAVPERR